MITYMQGFKLTELSRSLASTVHISRFGVIPKPHVPGKWRVILDLPSPDGHSINDGINAVDDAVTQILRLGQGTMLDIEHAFRNVPVHPSDWACHGGGTHLVSP